MSQSAIDVAVINTEFGTDPCRAVARARAESPRSFSEMLAEVEARAPLYSKLYDFGYEAVREKLRALAANEK